MSLNQTQRNILPLHFFVCSIGLLIIIYHASVLLGKDVSDHFATMIHPYEWVKETQQVNKPSQLLGYIIPTMGLFLYFLIATFYVKQMVQSSKINNLLQLNNLWKKGFYLSILLIINIYLMQFIFILNVFFSVCLVTLWCLAFFQPLIFKSKDALSTIQNKADIKLGYLYFASVERFFSTPFMRKVGLVLLCTLILQIVYTFHLFLKPTLYLSNDYLHIPEQTLMDASNDTYIDNLSFINQHRLGGLWVADPRISNKANLQFIKKEHDYIQVISSANLLTLIQENPSQFYFDSQKSALFIKGDTSQVKMESCKDVPSDALCQHIQQFIQYIGAQEKRGYTAEELNFIQKNMYELGNQLALGHFFLHQAFLLGAINQYSLDKPSSSILFMYGWLNTIGLTSVLKVMGGVSFVNYIRLTYLFYPLYYLAIILVARIIFKNIWETLFVGLVCFGGVFLISFEAIYMAPGFNPVRHFFDLAVLLAFYYYLFAKKNHFVFLVLAVSFCFLTYLCNQEFGLFVMGGISLAMLVKAIDEKRMDMKELALLALAVVFVAVSIISIHKASDAFSLYYLLGFLVPPTATSVIATCLISVSLIYTLIVFLNWNNKRWKYLLCYLFGFAQLSLVYYIWNPSPNHLYSMIFPWPFIVIILVKECFQSAKLMIGSQLSMCLMSMVFLIFYYWPSSKTYYLDQKTHMTIFKNHKLYDWDMPTAGFISTMSPEPFVNAIGLIHKYSHENGIYLLSEYDNLLPFLAKKYSAMPFDQLGIYLATDKEMQIAVDAILVNKPHYLFVDRNIATPHYAEISQYNDPALSVYSLTKTRFLVFKKNFSELFSRVSPEYKLIEQGQLISVYQHV